jgi:hypothetical protein
MLCPVSKLTVKAHRHIINPDGIFHPVQKKNNKNSVSLK